jgi:hypothetical protein
LNRRHSDRRHWDFGYEPSSVGYPAVPRVPEAQAPTLDVVVATRAPLDEAELRRVLADRAPDLEVEILIARAPLFWARLRASARASAEAIGERLRAGGFAFRYVASAHLGSMAVGPPLDLSDTPAADASGWAVRPSRPVAPGPASEGQWFLGDEGGGVRVDRRVCGTGAGTRLAVVDDDAADLDQVDLEDRVHVGTARASSTSGHGALMVAWATSARRPDGTRFVGIAPDASVRLYAVPKPGVDVVSLPLAIARAVFDGADVVVCATYVEGTTTPLLDDALDVASHLGRGGRGSIVVLPTGRETASAGGSLHASLSLEFGDPASDPRVHCVAPGGRPGGWFLWQSPRGVVRPFANRGPAVRWLSPGDDLAYPFSSRERLFHAESSGASAVAAGVMLLLLDGNPLLTAREVHAVLERTVDAPNEQPALEIGLADPADVLPSGTDRDGHNAKCGYGRLNATRACVAVSDPISLALSATGEDALAVAWRQSSLRPYSDRLGRWAAQAILSRQDMEHAVRAVLRHLRLTSTDPSRTTTHARGALARHLALVCRELIRMGPPDDVREELEVLDEALRKAADPGPNPESGLHLEESARAAFRAAAAQLPTSVEKTSFSTATLQP